MQAMVLVDLEFYQVEVCYKKKEKNLSCNEPRMKHIHIVYKRSVISPFSGIRYPTGAGVRQGAGKLGKGSKNSPLNKKV